MRICPNPVAKGEYLFSFSGAPHKETWAAGKGDTGKLVGHVWSGGMKNPTITIACPEKNPTETMEVICQLALRDADYSGRFFKGRSTNRGGGLRTVEFGPVYFVSTFGTQMIGKANPVRRDCAFRGPKIEKGS